MFSYRQCIVSTGLSSKPDLPREIRQILLSSESIDSTYSNESILSNHSISPLSIHGEGVGVGSTSRNCRHRFGKAFTLELKPLKVNQENLPQSFVSFLSTLV